MVTGVYLWSVISAKIGAHLCRVLYLMRVLQGNCFKMRVVFRQRAVTERTVFRQRAVAQRNRGRSCRGTEGGHTEDGFQTEGDHCIDGNHKLVR